jgi:hypothetical protein
MKYLLPFLIPLTASAQTVDPVVVTLTNNVVQVAPFSFGTFEKWELVHGQTVPFLVSFAAQLETNEKSWITNILILNAFYQKSPTPVNRDLLMDAVRDLLDKVIEANGLVTLPLTTIPALLPVKPVPNNESKKPAS